MHAFLHACICITYKLIASTVTHAETVSVTGSFLSILCCLYDPLPSLADFYSALFPFSLILDSVYVFLSFTLQSACSVPLILQQNQLHALLVCTYITIASEIEPL